MMLDKTERLNELLDWYEGLLTPKQQEVANLYYREDLSLSEIAELLKTSRAAVHDSLQRSESTLEHLESQLSLVKSRHERLKYYGQLKALSIDAVNCIVEDLEKCDE